MPYRDYNRYSILKKSDGTTELMPFINIPVSTSDKYEYWNGETSRLDILSQKYYGNPFYDFLIIYANGGFLTEFDIPDGTLIRIPYPLDRAKSYYEMYLTEYIK